MLSFLKKIPTDKFHQKQEVRELQTQHTNTTFSIISRVADNKSDAQVTNQSTHSIIQDRDMMDKVNIIIEDFFDNTFIEDVIQ